MFDCPNKDCPNWGKDKKLVRPSGPESDILVVGEGPGVDESFQGKPFVGRSGQLLRTELRRAGFNPDSVQMTNVVWCRPPVGEDGRNTAPSKKVITKCRTTFAADWLKLMERKRLVMLLGKTSANTIMGEKKRGRIKEIDGTILSSHFHPAYLLRTALEINQFREDLSLVKTLYDTGKAEKPVYEVIRSYRKLTSLVSRVEKWPYFSFDLETTGLDPFAKEAKIILCSLSSQEGNYVIPLSHPNSKLNMNTTITELKRLFALDAKKIAQNGKFDILWLKSSGIEVNNFWHDTMIAQYLLNAREFEAIGLKHLAWMYFPEYAGYEQGIDISKALEIPFDRLCEYAAMDAFLCRKIAEIQRPLMEEEGLMNVYEKVLSKASFSIAEVEFNGFKVDLPRVISSIETYTRREKELDTKIRSELPMTDLEKEEFKLGSQKQVSELLFNKFGLRSVKKTGAGKDSVSKDVLAALAETGNEFCKDMLELRHIQKLKGTYLENYQEMAGNDGTLIHCEYKLGARGGRLSSIHPNMQNLPKEMRKFFVSRYGADGSIMALDFKQAEMRVCALYGNDKILIKLFNDGVDIHIRQMAKALSLQYRREYKESEVTREQRQHGKSLNFGMIYGRGALSISKEYGVPLEEAQAFHDSFFSEFKGVKKFHEKMKALYHETGFSVSMLGRKRFLGEYEEHEAERRAINFPIQSLASDICLFVLCRLVEEFRRLGMKTMIVGTVHDSIVFDTYLDEVESIVEMIDRRIDNLGLDLFGKALPFRFDIDMEMGPTWGTMETI